MQQNNTFQSAMALEIYVVQNSNGEFFRAKGYGGSGQTWVKDINKAKLYPNTRGARHAVTFFANAYPNLEPPKLLKLTVGSVEELDEANRLQKAKERKEKVEAERKQREAEYALERAKRRMEDAQRELRQLHKQYGYPAKDS